MKNRYLADVVEGIKDVFKLSASLVLAVWWVGAAFVNHHSFPMLERDEAGNLRPRVPDAGHGLVSPLP